MAFRLPSPSRAPRAPRAQSRASRILAFAVVAIAGACTAVIASGCAELRRADVSVSSEGGADSDPDAGAADAPTDGAVLDLAPPSDDTLPKVTYRAVSAVAPDRVFIVGDETILEFVGTKWRYVPVGGVELHGVWADADDAWAVGFQKNTNTGVIMHRDKATWIQFATVPHGLRSIYGSGAFRMATGNDGAVYYGTLPTPFENGSQLERAPEIAETLFSPILSGVGGNSPDKLVVAGGVGAFYRYEGGEIWSTAVDPTDRSRAYRCVLGAPNPALDVVLGANYYGLWHYRGPTDAEGHRIPTEMLYEDRDSITSSEKSITSIWGTGVERFVAVGTAGRFITFEYGKTAKVLATPAGSRDLNGVSGTSFDDVWVVGAEGLILHGAVPPP
jgi:hypothetical protein